MGSRQRNVLALQLVSICIAGGCSDGTTNVQPQPKAYFASVSVGSLFSCGTTSAGSTVCWGRNNYNQLGRGTAPDSTPTPTPIAAPALIQISTGFQHSCGLDRSGSVYCWGQSSSALGTGLSSCNAIDPLACGHIPARVATTVTFSTVSAGGLHTCGLDTGGFAWCWGWNQYGQLGSTAGPGCPVLCQATPAPVSGQRRFLSISAGNTHTCAITDTRDGYCWGYGLIGQLGTGSFTSSDVPVAVFGGLKFASIAASQDGDTSCGITAEELVYCWGIPINASSLKTATALPVAVGGGVHFKTLSLAGTHACGIATNGGAYCWGDNYRSTIGASPSDEPKPVAAGLNLTSVSTSASHTCGLDTAGEVYWWGDGSVGALGSGADRPTQTPVRVIHP